MSLMKLFQPLRCCWNSLHVRLLHNGKNQVIFNKKAINSRTMSSTTDVLAAKIKLDKQPMKPLRKKFASVVPGSVNLQVLGTGANGAPTAVYLFTDQSRYLFNCGEGTQRLAHEHKTKLARLEQIFVTRNSWTAVGGLPGLTLTIQDSGVLNVGLHGPPHLDKMLQSMRRFVVLKNLQVKTIDCTQTTHFEDNVLKVRSLPLYSSNENDMKLEKVAISYICKLKPRPGALILEKCVEHGVPPGPLLGQLKNGKDITLPDGRVVHSADVTEPSETTLGFIFIDVPSLDYLPALEKEASTFNALGSEVATVVHFSERIVLEDNRYQTFVEKNFLTNVQHIYLNSSSNLFSGYTATHRIQYQLNQLEPNVFPLLAESISLQQCLSTSLINNLKKTKLDEITERVAVEEAVTTTTEQQDIQNVSAMTSFHLRPNKGLDRTLEAKITPNDYIQETQLISGFPELLVKLRQQYETLPPSTAPAYPRIIFLGTGSCIPNKTRNVSSILVQTSPKAYTLFDCGEGTHGQIVRFFGTEKAEEVMRNLRFIYISHLHADHHIGLIDLINARRQLTTHDDKVTLLAPRQIEPWLNFYNERIETIDDAYTLVANGELLEEPHTCGEQAEAYGIAGISTCLVRHCPHSFGVAITLNEMYAGKPIKITYSGDTMPCSDLVELGHESTILIHEATMEDDLIEEAKAKTHSTISQAIEQGRDMQAMYTILTHFSQRYAKCPRLPNSIEFAEMQQNDESEKNNTTTGTYVEDAMKNISIAFDNMQVTIADLEHFHLLYPALYAMFVEYTDDLEQRALKRELKQERKRKLVENI